MSTPPSVLCNGCKKPTTRCTCPTNASSSSAHTGTYQCWPQAPVLQYQTPRRPGPQSGGQNLFPQSTSHSHAHMASYYPVYPQLMFDPRLKPSIPSTILPLQPIQQSFNPQYFHSGSLYPPSTPLHNSVQTPAAGSRPPNLSPIQQSPAPANYPKRKRADGTRTSSKRAKRSHSQSAINNENCNEVSVPGVGPAFASEIQPAPRPKPIFDYSPISKARSASDSKQAATDVWYFTRPLETRERPIGPIFDPQPLRTKPKAPFVGCRLCPLSSSWSTWSNINGIADTIRTHLLMKHGNEWRKIVVMEKLKGWDRLPRQKADSLMREPFTIEGFLERLARWIAVDDQSLNVVETPELRDLLLYLNADLNNTDIPHRTKITQVIFESYNCEWKKLVTELQNSLGRVSFTSDLWSDLNLRSFMAITAHFSAKDEHGNLMIRNRLIAFRRISGTHSGARLAEHFMEILKEVGIQHKIGMITLDNASNCGSMMEDLEQLLCDMGIPFQSEGNRIRCFPHVVNIAVKAALKELSVSAPNITNADDVPLIWESNDNDHEYQIALESDVVSKCRSLVSACRASGQRREDLQSTIKEGNSSKSFPHSKQLRCVELLRDMDVRWSSTYLMIDRVLELYPAIDVLLNKVKYKDIHRHLLDDIELQVLRDIADFLKIPHAVQTTLCGEKTPTLSAVLPTYEDLLEMLRSYRIICPQLRSAISVCIAKIEDYVNKSRKTRIYALAMIINPITKLKWVEEHWTREEHQAAKVWILGSMFEHRKAARSQPENQPSSRQPLRSTPLAPSMISAQSQASGLAYIRSLKANLQRSASQILSAPPGSLLDTTQASSAPQEVTPDTRTHAELQAEAAMADEKDKIAVADELQRYIEEGILDEMEYKDFSLTRYWQSRQYQFPNLYRVALDILPVQASSVACERVFSSSKETITMRRNGLSPELMEILQFLKYAYRQDRLNLMEGVLSSEQDLLAAEDISASTTEVRDLLTKGQISELIKLLNV